MIRIKQYRKDNVLTAAKKRISLIFDHFQKIYIAFSGGKDSTVMAHLVLEEARKRKKTVALVYIDLEAQYTDSVKHVASMYEEYADTIEPHWVCVPMLLRNAVTNYEPQWIAWDMAKQSLWVREMPETAKTVEDYPFLIDGYPIEFEEFVVLFGNWFAGEETSAGFIGIRADESLHRYCAVASYQKKGKTFMDRRWTSKQGRSFSIYPIYDWTTDDIWVYHGKNPDMLHNPIYDKMQMAGVKLSQQRLCQPYGDDQKKGLWLYQVLEPDTWGKLINRVGGVNSGALYCQESGNVTGARVITKPEEHTWKSYSNMLLATLPGKTREHYRGRIVKWLHGWHKRGYEIIPDEAPRELESKCWVPSWRRVCRVILRNDYWCKGLGQCQPKSEAYEKFKDIRKARKLREKEAKNAG
jgi:predicted phosphoadenosine phosphosulfate sulfurtransferase